MPTSTPEANSYAAYDTAHCSLRRQILRECEEMAEYAFASGMRVPPGVMQVVETAVQASRESDSGDAPYDPTGQEIARLTAVHEQLAKVVAPATPRALVILADHRKEAGFFGPLFPVPFIRRMMVTAGLSLLAFIVLASTPGIDGEAVIAAKGGLAVLGNICFLVTAAALGASFSGLVQASTYISNRTWDPQYEITYWIKFIVGLMAGLMLCMLIDLDLGSGTIGTTGAAAEDGSGVVGIADTAAAFSEPLLALLGGFSASAVYRILDRLVETVESLVRGSAREAISAAEEQARIRAQAQAEQLRLRMAADLLTLQQQMGAGGDPAAMRRQLDTLVGTMIPERTPSVDNAPPPPYSMPAAAAPALSSAQETASPAAGGAHHGADESEGEEADDDATAVATMAPPAPSATLDIPLVVSPVRPPEDDDDGAVG